MNHFENGGEDSCKVEEPDVDTALDETEQFDYDARQAELNEWNLPQTLETATPNVVSSIRKRRRAPVKRRSARQRAESAADATLLAAENANTYDSAASVVSDARHIAHSISSTQSDIQTLVALLSRELAEHTPKRRQTIDVSGTPPEVANHPSFKSLLSSLNGSIHTHKLVTGRYARLVRQVDELLDRCAAIEARSASDVGRAQTRHRSSATSMVQFVAASDKHSLERVWADVDGNHSAISRVAHPRSALVLGGTLGAIGVSTEEASVAIVPRGVPASQRMTTSIARALFSPLDRSQAHGAERRSAVCASTHADALLRSAFSADRAHRISAPVMFTIEAPDSK